MLHKRSMDELAADMSPAAQAISVTDLAPVVRRYAGLVFGVISIFVSAAVVYILTATPTFVATTQLLIESQKGQPFMLEPGLLDLTIDNAHVESQVEVIRSERISLAVIRQLGLTADPEFRGETDPGSEAERLRPSIRNFAERLGVRRIGQSYVIEVAFRSEVAGKSARIANAVVEAYLLDQIDARAETAKQGTRWLQSRIDEMSVQLRNAARAVQEFRLTREASSPTDRLAIIDAETHLAELDSRVQSYRKLQENMLQKLTETAQKQSLAVTNARVITPATTPLGKNTPRTKLVLAMAVLAGLLVGVGLAAMLHGNDRSVRSATAVRRLPGIAFAADLPLIGTSHRPRRGGLGPVAVVPVAVNRKWRFWKKQETPAVLAGVADSYSPFGDALRSAKVSIDVAGLTKPTRCIGVTSVERGVGVSTVAASLAALYAAAGVRTLLIDGNVRDSFLTREFSGMSAAVPVKPEDTRPGIQGGLLNLLRQDHAGITAPGFMLVPGTKAEFMPVGITEGAFAGADMLGSPRMRALIDSLRKMFDITIFDLPALGHVSDARAVAGHLDVMIVVAACGATIIGDVQDAVEQLERANAGLIAVLVNKGSEV
ncbi:MAG: GumC family protein [Beijerinckiaceae bacterium]